MLQRRQRRRKLWSVVTLELEMLDEQYIVWWLAVDAVLSKEEMLLPNEINLADEERAFMVEWLFNMLQTVEKLQEARRKLHFDGSRDTKTTMRIRIY